MDKKRDTISIIIYLAFAYGIAYFGFFLWFVLKYEMAAIIAISGPIIGYFMVRLIRKDTPKVNFKNISGRCILWGAGIPIAYTIASIILYLCMHGEIAFEKLSVSALLASVLQWIFAGICEEVGWRGFLFPTLKRWNGDGKAYVICGLIWSGWHLPMIFSNTIMTSWPHWAGVVLLCTEGITMSIMIDKLMKLSNMSIWTCVLFHGIHNAIVQVLLTLVPQKGFLYVDDGGITSLLTIIIAAILLCLFDCRKKKQMREDSHQDSKARVK